MEPEMTTPPSTYSLEFKEEAVRLVLTTHRSCAEVARDLGIAPNLVVRWKQQHVDRTGVGRPSFTGRGVPARTPQEARLVHLERELEIARQERDIMKKAVAFFAKESR